ncbi:MAG: hypothetical protein J5929_06500 [Eubacterium sp.]|nr:hypothetical protein [Eubacterium sp.]
MDILFREGSEKNTVTLSEETLSDLAVSEIIESITIKEEEQIIIKKIMSEIPQDLEDIRFRQEIMRDMIKNEAITKSLGECIDQIRVLRSYAGRAAVGNNIETTLFSLLEDMRELGVYVSAVEQIADSLSVANPSSKGLISLRNELNSITQQEEFKAVKSDVEKLLKDLSNVRSLTVGINLTPDLNINEIADVEFNEYYHKPSLKARIMETALGVGTIVNSGSSGNQSGMHATQFTSIRDPDQMLSPLAPVMNKKLKKYYRELKSTLVKHMNIDGYFIINLLEGLTFYVGMARFAIRLRELGCEICTPDITGTPDFRLKDFYNVRLAIRGEKDIVLNDFEFTPKEKLFILTGPNRGGKTILEQGIGLTSLMASIGAFVTAKECSGTPFKNILTHFPQDENLTINYGRLGEEAVRIREIAKAADSGTLILFNETYSTTSNADGLYLSKDLMHLLKDKGAAVIFNTHIHELAGDIDEMNKWGGESEIVSIIMEIIDEKNTFHVKRSAPDMNSHAKNVARKYGITYEQMIEG